MEKVLFKKGTLKLFLFAVFSTVLSMQSLYSQDNINTQKKDTIYNKDDFNPWDRFSLNLGYFFSGENSGIYLGSGQLGIGLVIDLEDALALKTNTIVFRASTSYTLSKSKRHKIILDYFSINRKASKVLEEDLEIGDEIYPIGTKIESKFYLSTIRLKYDYSFYQDERVSLGSSFGFFILPINFSVQSEDFKNQSAKIIAPLPVLGLRFNFAVTPKFILKQEADLLYLKIDKFTGSLIDLNFALEYKIFNHFGLGMGINSNRIQIKAKGNDYPNIDFFGDIRMEYTGVKLYASYFF